MARMTKAQRAELERIERQAEAAWWQSQQAEDEVDYERWLDSLPQPTDDEEQELESRYLSSWERQAYER